MSNLLKNLSDLLSSEINLDQNRIDNTNVPMVFSDALDAVVPVEFFGEQSPKNPQDRRQGGSLSLPLQSKRAPDSKYFGPRPLFWP